MKPIHYAGIGSRETPPEVCAQMTYLASKFESWNFCLRSGGAIGADRAFEAGVMFSSKKRIYRADAAAGDIAAFELAEKFHPTWDKLSVDARRLHARNGYILLGPELNDPVNFICCWTPGGAVTGGTGQALRIAADRNIPVFNLADMDATEKLIDFAVGLRSRRAFS
jgi:hypothetical protein